MLCDWMLVLIVTIHSMQATFKVQMLARFQPKDYKYFPPFNFMAAC